MIPYPVTWLRAQKGDSKEEETEHELRIQMELAEEEMKVLKRKVTEVEVRTTFNKTPFCNKLGCFCGNLALKRITGIKLVLES